MNAAIAEAATIALASVILVISAVKVRRGWFGPPVSSRTSRLLFWFALISFFALSAIVLTFLYTTGRTPPDLGLVSSGAVAAVCTVNFAGGWRHNTQPANPDFAAAREAEPGSYLASIVFMGFALVLVMAGTAATVGLF